MIIAVDGTASSGKGTLARRVAAHHGLPHLDTGLLYRAVGQRMLDFRHDLDASEHAIDIARAFSPVWIDDKRLRSAEAGAAASRIAIVPEVRRALRDFQVAFANRPGGAVLDGRDIGTVIAPDAGVKLWVDARPEARANRRWRELVAHGESITEAEVLAALRARDQRDAPNMIRADDAVLLDTTELDIDAAVSAALAIVESRRSALDA
jgi:CMP/dCMP kinase